MSKTPQPGPETAPTAGPGHPPRPAAPFVPLFDVLASDSSVTRPGPMLGPDTQAGLTSKDLYATFYDGSSSPFATNFGLALPGEAARGTSLQLSFDAILNSEANKAKLELFTTQPFGGRRWLRGVNTWIRGSKPVQGVAAQAQGPYCPLGQDGGALRAQDDNGEHGEQDELYRAGIGLVHMATPDAWFPASFRGLELSLQSSRFSVALDLYARFPVGFDPHAQAANGIQGVAGQQLQGGGVGGAAGQGRRIGPDGEPLPYHAHNNHNNNHMNHGNNLNNHVNGYSFQHQQHQQQQARPINSEVFCPSQPAQLAARFPAKLSAVVRLGPPDSQFFVGAKLSSDARWLDQIHGGVFLACLPRHSRHLRLPQGGLLTGEALTGVVAPSTGLVKPGVDPETPVEHRGLFRQLAARTAVVYGMNFRDSGSDVWRTGAVAERVTSFLSLDMPFVNGLGPASVSIGAAMSHADGRLRNLSILGAQRLVKWRSQAELTLMGGAYWTGTGQNKLQPLATTASLEWRYKLGTLTAYASKEGDQPVSLGCGIGISAL